MPIIKKSSGGGGTSLPSQSGHSGQYLTTNGTTLSWGSPSAGGTLDPASSSSIIENFDDFDSYNYSGGSPSTIAMGPFHLTASAGVTRSQPASGESNRVGIVQMVASAAAESLYAGFQSILLGGLTSHVFATSVTFSRIPTSAADSWLGQWGIQDSSTAYNNAGNAITLRVTYLSANWVAQCTSAGTTTFVDTGVPYAVNTWYNLRIVSTPTSVTAYINGTLVSTISTNIPTTAVMGPVLAVTWQAGTAVTVRYDWIYQNYQLAAARGTF